MRLDLNEQLTEAGYEATSGNTIQLGLESLVNTWKTAFTELKVYNLARFQVMPLFDGSKSLWTAFGSMQNGGYKSSFSVLRLWTGAL